MDQLLLPLIVAVGASGSEGLHDICDMLQGLPSALPAVLMVVLHRPSQQQHGHLRDVLARAASLPVVVAAPAERLSAGVCYIGEPASHLTLAPGGMVHLVEGGLDRYRNGTIDLLFASVAANAGSRGVAVVLSGALSDGTDGITLVHRAGGTTMVLTPGDKPHGMQQSAIDERGMVDVIGTCADIVAAIVARAGQR